MSFLTKFSTIIWLSLCLVLSACGGGGDSDTSTPPNNNDGSNSGGDTGGGDTGGGDQDSTDDSGNNGDGSDDSGSGTDDSGVDYVGPEREGNAPTLEVISDIKQLHFSWDAYADDDHYHLWESANGGGGSENVGDFSDTDQAAHDIAVHRMNWADATYIIEACAPHDGDDHNQCYDSAPVGIEEAMLGAIGYFKPFGTETDNNFGASVAVSDDGQTMAVGAGQTGAAGSVYIFTRVDATWQETAQVTASNAEAGDNFGTSLALSSDGQTLIVGAPGEDGAAGSDGSDNAVPDAGAVYVFSLSDGDWAQTAYVKASNAGEGDAFGHSVALAGDGQSLAVGAPGEASAATGLGGNADDDSAQGAGAAYAFNLADGSWTQSTYIKASNTEAGDEFGWSLALSVDGQLLAVGAAGEDSATAGSQEDNTASQAGAVYVFTGGNADWQQAAYLKASNAVADSQFGYSLDLSGDGNTLAASARGADAAYLFTGNGGWAEQAMVGPAQGQTDVQFGTSVALSRDGTTLAVGAPGDDSDATGINGGATGGATDAGVVYTFVQSDGSWTQQAYVKAPNTDSEDLFGSSVALSEEGDTLAAGAPGEDSSANGIGGDQEDNAAQDTGAVYLY